MAGIEKKSFDVPDETRNPYQKGRIDVLIVGDARQWEVKRASIGPGWRFTKHTSAVVGTQLCELFHIKYIIQGRFGFRMKDGTEMEFGPGEVAIVDPGHDAWVVGDQPCVFIDLADVVRQAGGRP